MNYFNRTDFFQSPRTASSEAKKLSSDFSVLADLEWWSAVPSRQMRAARMALDEKQSTFASVIGVKQKQIGAIEAGEAVPPKGYVDAILRIGMKKNPLWFDEKREARLREIAAGHSVSPEEKDFISPFSRKSDQALSTVSSDDIVKSHYALGLDWDDLARTYDALSSPVGNMRVKELCRESAKNPPKDIGRQRIMFLVDTMRWVGMQNEAAVIAFKNKVKKWDGGEKEEVVIEDTMEVPPDIIPPLDKSRHEFEPEPTRSSISLNENCGSQQVLSAQSESNGIKPAKALEELKHFAPKTATALAIATVGLNQLARQAPPSYNLNALAETISTFFPLDHVSEIPLTEELARPLSIQTSPALLNAIQAACKATLVNPQLKTLWIRASTPLCGRKLGDIYEKARMGELNFSSVEMVKSSAVEKVIASRDNESIRCSGL